MEQHELLRYLVQCFEKLNIPYFLTGAIASIAYGEPRLTNDIDVVADIKGKDISWFKECFPEEEFYLDKDSMKDAIRRCGHFNIIHPSSGLKVDIFISKDDTFDRNRFSRVKKIRPTEDTEANFASIEDVIIKKMEYYREGRSEKHLRDITGMIKISGDQIDYEYITGWADKLDLQIIWQAILKRITR